MSTDTRPTAMTAERPPPDDETFRQFVEPHRAALHAHCYQMLGSVHDADDAVQDALVRAWRGLHHFEGRSAPRTWLHRIATNVCLDALAHRHRRVLPIDYGPAVDPADPGRALDATIWIEPYPDAEVGLATGPAAPEARYEVREAVELAFVAALQYLPARQRAVLVLRDVFGFSAREVAEALDTTTASVNSALQRARRSLDERLPPQSQQATRRAMGDEHVRELVEQLIHAFERGEIPAILALLQHDATFERPPFTGWCRGRDAVGRSWLMPEGPAPRLRYLLTSANGQPAAGTYALDPDRGDYRAIALDVFTLDGASVAGVVAFCTPSLFARFGLPDRLAG